MLQIETLFDNGIRILKSLSSHNLALKIPLYTWSRSVEKTAVAPRCRKSTLRDVCRGDNVLQSPVGVVMLMNHARLPEVYLVFHDAVIQFL